MAEDLIERAAQALWEFEQGALGKSASGPFPEHERAMWVGRVRAVLDATLGREMMNRYQDMEAMLGYLAAFMRVRNPESPLLKQIDALLRNEVLEP